MSEAKNKAQEMISVTYELTRRALVVSKRTQGEGKMGNNKDTHKHIYRDSIALVSEC